MKSVYLVRVIAKTPEDCRRIPDMEFNGELLAPDESLLLAIINGEESEIMGDAPKPLLKRWAELHGWPSQAIDALLSQMVGLS